jgi:hypothetical protein
MRIGRDMKGNVGDLLQGTSAYSKHTQAWWLGVRFSVAAETYLNHDTHTSHSDTVTYPVGNLDPFPDHKADMKAHN